MSTPGGVVAGRGAETRPPCRSPGLAFLLPGVPQWLWGQRERAVLLGGSFVASLSVGLFAWGTAAGVALLAFAYVLHVASTSDAIRQWAFPGFGRWVPMVSASAGLAAGGYGPLIVLGALVAWPGMERGAPRSGYLIDRLAYRAEGRPPGPGDHVWLAPTPGGRGGRLAEVLGRPGDDVEWADGRLQVAGRRLGLAPFRPGQAPKSLAFKVPDGHVMVAYHQTDDPLVPRTWELVPESRVEGRAWAKLYPVWERRLLN